MDVTHVILLSDEAGAAPYILQNHGYKHYLTLHLAKEFYYFIAVFGVTGDDLQSGIGDAFRGNLNS